jgi:hypothetical protein
VRLTQPVDAKDLRRLRGPAAGAVRRFDDASVHDALDRVVHRRSENGRPLAGSDFDGPCDGARRHQGARGVVHGDEFTIARQRREPGAHRVLALRAARHGRGQLGLRRGAREQRGEAPQFLCGHYRLHAHHRLHRRERLDGV